MPEIDTTVVQHFLIALAIGALVGVEREKQKNTKSQTTFGGDTHFHSVRASGRRGCLVIAKSQYTLDIHRGIGRRGGRGNYGLHS